MDAQGSIMSLFQPPAIERTVQKHEWIEYKPIGQIVEGGPIEFNISGNSADYIDLQKSRIAIKVKVQTSKGVAVTSENAVALVNLSLHALFRQLDVTLQQKVISPDVGTSYPYKAIIDALLKTDETVKLSRMQTENYFKDTSGAMNATDPETGGNAGLLQRYALTALGNELVMEGPLYHDMCQQNRAILNNVRIGVKLFPSLDAFRLMANDDDAYKVIIMDATLKACHVKVHPEVVLAQDHALQEGPAIYPIQQSQIISHSIAKGSFNFTLDGVYNGDVPSNIVIGLVSAEAYAASYKKNYADFANFGLNFLEFTIDGSSAPIKTVSTGL